MESDTNRSIRERQFDPSDIDTYYLPNFSDMCREWYWHSLLRSCNTYPFPFALFRLSSTYQRDQVSRTKRSIRIAPPRWNAQRVPRDTRFDTRLSIEFKTLRGARNEKLHERGDGCNVLIKAVTRFDEESRRWKVWKVPRPGSEQSPEVNHPELVGRDKCFLDVRKRGGSYVNVIHRVFNLDE